MKVKKSHIWIEAVKARCPYCGDERHHYGVADEGDLVRCFKCSEQFQLGKQR